MALRLDGRFVKMAIARMKNGVYTDQELRSKIVDAQKKVENNVKLRLRNQRKYDPSATTSKNTGAVTAIEKNITTGFETRGVGNRIAKKIRIGTGDIGKMDQYDFLFSTNNPARKPRNAKVRMWRILELGTGIHAGTGKYSIAARKPQKQLLHFYWKKARKWFKGPVVNHPGVEGRHYFFKDSTTLIGEQVAYESDKIVIQDIEEALGSYVEKHSARRG